MNNNENTNDNVNDVAAPFSVPVESSTDEKAVDEKGGADQKMEDEFKNMSDEEMINLFVEGLMEEKGIDLGDEPYKNDVFVDLRQQLMSEIDRSLIAELPEDKLDEFDKMVKNGKQIDPAMVSQAVIDAKLDVPKITLGTMARFKEIYLGGEEDDEE